MAAKGQLEARGLISVSQKHLQQKVNCNSVTAKQCGSTLSRCESPNALRVVNPRRVNKKTVAELRPFEYVSLGSGLASHSESKTAEQGWQVIRSLVHLIQKMNKHR